MQERKGGDSLLSWFEDIKTVMPDWKLQPQLVCRLKPREEGCDIAAEPLGLLDRDEVPSARHRGPPAHVVQALGPLAGRRSVVDKLVGEDGDPGRHADEVPQPERDTEPPVVEVVPDARR